MNRVVLDSSAFLAMSLKEPGAERVIPILEKSVVSTVIVTEIVSKLIREGMQLAAAEEYVRRFIQEIVPHDWSLGVRAASLITVTMPLGLSLGDRSCLALAQQMNLPVFTADQAWAKLDIGVQIELIRPMAA